MLGGGEAASVTRLVMEDLFRHKKGRRERVLGDTEIALAEQTLDRLLAGEPVQYITGVADFYGLQLHVTPAVLIPRPETEELVEWILSEYGKREAVRLADVGTGSGCIPLAVKARRPPWSCEGWELSRAALEVARENARRLDIDVAFISGDMRQDSAPLPDEHYDIIVSNPPYIPPSERDRMSSSTLEYEPGIALFTPEDDPLLYYRSLAKLGLDALCDGGDLYLEVNEHNSGEVARLVRAAGYHDVERRRDLQGKWRMVRARRPRA